MVAMLGPVLTYLQPRAAEAPPPGNASDYSGTGVQAYLTVVTVLSVLAVVLRFWSRYIQVGDRGRHGTSFWWDDWMALISLIPLAALAGHIYAMFNYGLGKHAWTLSEDDLSTQLKILFSGNFMFDICVFSTKLCVLLFFNRVFPAHANSTWFNWAIRITHGLNIGWLIGICVASFFMCIPMEASWNPHVQGDCSNQVQIYIGSAISSVIIDFIILLMPIPKIWSLQMSVGKKSGLMVVFLLGYLVIVVSLGRMVTMVKKAEAMAVDPSYEFAKMLFWVLAEGPTSLISACLPALMPLMRRAFGKFTTAFTTHVSSNSRTTPRTDGSKTNLSAVREDGTPGIAMHPYYTVDKAAAVRRQKDDEESFGSSDSARGILPAESWHSSRVEKGNRSVADAQDTPSNRIRVHRGFAVSEYD